MASYGAVTDDYANTTGGGGRRENTLLDPHGGGGYPNQSSTTTTHISLLKKIVENRWVNLLLFFLLWLIVLASIACVTVIGVLHYHLLFVCGYAEFIFLVTLEGIVLSFCLYHIFHIFQHFKKRAQQNPVKGPLAWFTNPSSSSYIHSHHHHHHGHHYNNDYDDGEDEERQRSTDVDGGAAAAHNNNHNVDYDEEDDDEEYDDEVDEENEGEESRTTKIFIFTLKFLSLLASIAAMILLLLFTVIALPIQQGTLPQTSGTLTFASGKITGASPPVITRETNGVIHIEAQSVHDALFAQGVAHAQDRMWQLEFNKRTGAGTLAEIAGSAALNVDKGARTFGFRQSARALVDKIPEETKAMIQAYCDGINAYLDSKPTLAPEFSILKTKPTKWEVLDVVTWVKVMSFSLSANAHNEVLRYKLLQQGLTKERIDQLMPLYPKQKLTVLDAHQLNITLTEEEIEEIESRLADSSAFYQPSLVNVTKSSNNNGNSNGFYSPMKLKILRDAFENVFINPNMAKASNNWVVGGQFSKSGKPLLADDPHLEQTAPGLIHLNHLKTDGLNVIGASFPGCPGIIIGRNQDVAWGVTNSLADTQDVFAIQEKIAGETYTHKGADKKYVKRTETIKVKGKSDVTLTVLETVYGPVINDVFDVAEGVPLALHWVGASQDDTSIVGLLKMNLAKTYEEFLAAVKLLVGLSQNYVFADTQGNFGYALSGRIPVRAEGHSGRFVVPGNGTYDYFDAPDNYIPDEKMPRVINPDRGFISSANNRITPRGFEYSISQDYPQMYRAQRIDSLLSHLTSNGTVTWKDMRNIQMDVKSELFEDFRFVFTQLAGNVSKEIDTWREKLVKWDAEEKLYSQEASIFEMWYYKMGSIVAKETNSVIKNWRDSAFWVNALRHNDVACTVSHNKTCLAVAGIVLQHSVEELEKTYGSIPLWGSDVHQVNFNHKLLGGSTIGCLTSKTLMNIGGTETANVGDINDQFLGTFAGVSYRQIIDLANDYKGGEAPSSDKFIIPLGQSGNFLSPQYDNLVQKWKDGEYVNMKMEGFESYKKLTIKTK